MAEYDFIVVGSGSAGAIVATRLSEDRDNSVLLVEAGPADRSPIFRIPAAARYAFNARKYNWNFESEPEPYLNNRRLKQPRGRVLGGSSSINGLVYLRGNPLDYEGWAQAGAPNWSYAQVLPYFKRLEKWAEVDNEYKGGVGPVRVSEAEPLNPIAAAFVQAGEEAGYQKTEDVNGYCQEGFGRFPMNAADGIRSSTAVAYLHPNRSRPNLTIMTGCEVQRLRIKAKRAEAIEVRHQGDQKIIRARREIVLSAGPINDPQLLMLSGVGPGDQLRRHDIDVVQDLPGVGENLQDHALATLQIQSKAPVSLAAHLGLGAKVKALFDWVSGRRGILASNHFQSGAFIRSDRGVPFPDLQLYLFPIGVSIGSNDFLTSHAFQVQISSQRSESRGWVRLKSNNPREAPLIQFNMMSQDQDWREMRSALRLAREVVAQPAMDFCRGDEISPGRQVQSAGEIDAFLRDNIGSSYHPSGTCKMGIDGMAVVDPECRVHGIEGLRVADSAIMPLIPSCNLNAPTMMIGERAADFILGKRLEPENLGYFKDSEWEIRQRPGQPVRAIEPSS